MKSKSKEMTIKEKRMKVLEKKTSERIKKEVEMGIVKSTSEPNDKVPKIKASPTKARVCYQINHPLL